MCIAERKVFELQQKLHSLKLEFDDWRTKSEGGNTLEKHHTQIRRITNQLEGYQQEIKKDLDHISGTEGDILAQGRKLESQMLELHRIWEFFRSKFALRSVDWFSYYLVAADEFAWDCYRAAQLRVDPKHLDPQEIKEPPLVFFNGSLSPYSMPRKYAYQAEAIPRDQPKDKKRFFDLLSDLPIPLVGIPWSQIQHLPQALVIGHEIGHIVRDDLRLQKRTEDLLEAGLEKGEVPEPRREGWREWLDETFADIYGNLGTGPAFVGSLMDFLATSETDVTKEALSNLNWGDYPTAYLRVLLNLEVLARQGFRDESAQLQNVWHTTYPTHAMREFERDIPFIVETLLDGPYPELGNIPLTDVISFTRPNQVAAVADAHRILNDGRPDSSNVRVLYASARWAFASDPEGYEKQGGQHLILDRILQVRELGVRRSFAVANELDDYDLEAGRKLFTKFTKFTTLSNVQ